jgi:hypothetical protein
VTQNLFFNSVSLPLIFIEQYAIQLTLNAVGFEVFTAVVMKSIIFWDMTPCSPLSCNRRFGGILLDTCLPAGSSRYYSSTLKMEAIRFSETSGTTQRTTQRHIPEDTLQNHCCENLKSYKIKVVRFFFFQNTNTTVTAELLTYILNVPGLIIGPEADCYD